MQTILRRTILVILVAIVVGSIGLPSSETSRRSIINSIKSKVHVLEEDIYRSFPKWWPKGF